MLEYRSNYRLLLICLLSLATYACGQKGDLTLPEHQPQQGAVTAPLETGVRQA